MPPRRLAGRWQVAQCSNRIGRDVLVEGRLTRAADGSAACCAGRARRDAGRRGDRRKSKGRGRSQKLRQFLTKLKSGRKCELIIRVKRHHFPSPSCRFGRRPRLGRFFTPPPRRLVVPASATGRCSRSVPHREAIDRYCVTCHNQRAQDRRPGARRARPRRSCASTPRSWEKVVRKLRAGAMPPQGAPARRRHLRASSSDWLEDELDRAAAAHAESRAAAAAPAEPRGVHQRHPRSAGARRRRRVAAAARRLGLRLRQHLRRARRVAVAAGALPGGGREDQRAGGRRSRRCAPGSDTYRVRQDLSQNQHVEGLPLGTVGGLRVRHTFPLDGEYIPDQALSHQPEHRARARVPAASSRSRSTASAVHLVTIGGNDDLAALFEKPTDTGDAVEARMRVRVPVTAGPHDVTVAFVENLAVKDTRAAAAVPAQLGRQLRLGGAAAHPDASRSPDRSTRPGRATRRAAAQIFTLPAGVARRAEARAARRRSLGRWRAAPIASR